MIRAIWAVIVLGVCVALFSGCVMSVKCRGVDGTPSCVTSAEHGADCAAAVRACTGQGY